MDVIRAIILGIVQGLTEFLPVSSSGHLEIVNHFFSTENGLDSDLTMVIVAHLGTALSICFVFWKDISNILVALFRWRRDENTELAIKILISMIPALVIGLLFEEKIEALFASESLLFVGIFLCFTALVLWFTPQKLEGERVSFVDSLLIGISQAIAILPGVSRSGMTIATGLYLGVSKERAARFSFLMVLPVIFGKVILDLLGGGFQLTTTSVTPVLAALLSSFLVGIWACNWMIKIVKQSKLSYFAIYCLAVGLLVILYHFFL